MKKLITVFITLFLAIYLYSEYGNAFIFGERILSLSKNSTDSFQKDIVLKSVAFLYAQTENEEEGVAALKMIKNQSEFVPAVMTFIRILCDKANFEKALRLTDLIDEEYGSEMLIDIAERMLDNGRINECRVVAEKAEKSIGEGMDSYKKAKFLSRLSSIRYRLKETPKALDLVSKALWTAQSIKDPDKKAFALKDVALAYSSMNNRLISMFVENQINQTKNPITLMEIASDYIDASESSSAERFLNTAKSRAEKESDLKLKSKMLYDAAEIYSLLNKKKTSQDCANLSLNASKLIQSRVDRINGMIRANNIFKSDDVYSTALQEIILVNEYYVKVRMMLDISSGYMTMGLKDKGFFLVKVILGELKKSGDVEQLEKVLEKISDIYTEYGNESECNDFIFRLKRDYANQALIISKMYYSNGNYRNSLKYADKVKDYKKRTVQKIKITEMIFREEDKDISHEALAGMLKEISNSTDILYKSILLSEVALLCVKYEITLEKNTLSILERI